MKPQRNIPSLDGLRAISIGLVIIEHINQRLSNGVPPHSFRSRVLSFLFLGHLGVMVFFVISGFLITTLLLREQRINLARFYFRRTMRIFPPYYAYVLVIIGLTLAGIFKVPLWNILAALTYTSNYCLNCSGSDSWYLAHSWSLAVEEQFYLIWPATLLLLGKRNGLWVALMMMIACPMLRLYHVIGGSQDVIFVRFELIADSIAIGCLLAGARSWLHRRRWYASALQSKFSALAPALALFIGLLPGYPSLYPASLYVGLAITIQNISIAFSIDWCMTYHTGRIGRLLNARPIIFIGIISYSLYLWQQLFLISAPTLPIALELILVAVASLSSYYLIELPSLRARHYIEGKLSARAHADTTDSIPISP